MFSLVNSSKVRGLLLNNLKKSFVTHSAVPILVMKYKASENSNFYDFQYNPNTSLLERTGRIIKMCKFTKRKRILALIFRISSHYIKRFHDMLIRKLVIRPNIIKKGSVHTC